MTDFAIWIVGLLACGTLGGLFWSYVLGSSDPERGVFLGVFAFVIVRLWRRPEFWKP